MSCEVRVTLDYIPNTAATIGVTSDGVTDTLDLKDAVLNVESKTHVRLNRLTGNLEHWNESYVSTGDESYLEAIPIAEMLEFGNLEDLGNVTETRPKNGDILYYKTDSSCGPNCIGVNDKWTKLHAPTEDGKYKLTMTVENGEPTIEWEKEEEE